MTDGAPSIVLVDSPGRLAARLADPFDAAGFDVTVVASATDCLRRVERGPVDAVVSAYALPDLDGVRLLRSIRVSHPSLPFVLITADGSESIASDAVAADVSGYFPTVDAERVVARLRACLDRERPWVDGQTQQRYRHLIEMSPAPINVFDAEGESIWCNDAVVDLLGLDDRDDLIGHSIFEFVHPDDRDLARTELADVVDRKESVGPTRMRLQRPDGAIRHVVVSTAVGRFLDEDVGQAVFVDVTPIQEIRATLRDERQFVEEALDALQDVFYVVDADGDLRRWNAAASAVTGYGDDELADMNVAALFAAEDRARVLDSLDAVLATGGDTVEATLRTATGRTIPYEFRGRRLSDAPDDEPRVVGIGRDVSERRERKRQLQVVEQWLRHNIRNEMNVVRGLAEDVRTGRAEDPAATAGRIEEHTDHLVAQADRERRIVALLTDPPEPVRTDLAALLEEAVAGGRERHPDATIAVDRVADVAVTAIPDLSAAVRELVDNAVSFGGDVVRVEAVVDDGRAVVRVRDDGPGIPDIESEPLLSTCDIDQLHHSSGLGLLFVYWVARLSGGDLDVSTNEPRGSTVTITLPLAGA